MGLRSLVGFTRNLSKERATFSGSMQAGTGSRNWTKFCNAYKDWNGKKYNELQTLLNKHGVSTWDT